MLKTQVMWGASILEILSFAAMANTYVACNKTHSERIVTTNCWVYSETLW